VTRLGVVAEHLRGWVMDPESLAERILADLNAYDLAHAPVAPARRTDPATSRKGAADVAPRAGSQRHRLLLAYQARPAGLMDAEAARLAALPARACFWHRCSELVDGGYIEVIGERTDPATGSAGRVARITDKGMAVLA
jgi:hypothetical protein